MKLLLFSFALLAQTDFFEIIKDEGEEFIQPRNTTVKDSMQVDPKDQILEKKVIERLGFGWSAHKYTNVQVRVANGSATLTGSVKSTSDKLDVERKAKEVFGIKSVINRIQVVPIEGPIK